jgi:D-aspartate ligase
MKDASPTSSKVRFTGRNRERSWQQIGRRFLTKKNGALIIGGNYRGLSIVRSLGRKGVPAWITTQSPELLACFSRYAGKTLPWTQGGSEEQVAHLLRLAEQYQLNGWVLFPTDDSSASLVAKFRDELSHRYAVTTPGWEVLRWAFDKRLTYQLAAEQQVDCPRTFYPSTEKDLATADCRFPAILKPATHASTNRFTVDKAWPVADREELLARYREAHELVSPDLILLQEMIPGGGSAQFSYAALCRDGRPIVSLTARRMRQYPIDFGHSSCFVETVDVPEIVAPSQRLLAAIRYTGLVELEYKFDARDSRYKLLDINPRIWTWSPLGGRAGVDFPYLLWRLMMGKAVAEQTGRVGVRWIRMSTDILAAAQEGFRGRLTLGSYLRSWRSPVEFALAAADDPLPGLLELPMCAYSYWMNHFRRNHA